MVGGEKINGFSLKLNKIHFQRVNPEVEKCHRLEAYHLEKKNQLHIRGYLEKQKQVSYWNQVTFAQAGQLESNEDHAIN